MERIVDAKVLAARSKSLALPALGHFLRGTGTA